MGPVLFNSPGPGEIPHAQMNLHCQTSAQEDSRTGNLEWLINGMAGLHHDCQLQVQAQIQQERQTTTGAAAGIEIREERYGPDPTMAREVAYMPATSPSPAAKVHLSFLAALH